MCIAFEAKMRVILVVFSLYIGFGNGYIVRPFPKPVPTGRGQEMVAKLRMPGAVPKTVIFIIIPIVFF